MNIIQFFFARVYSFYLERLSVAKRSALVFTSFVVGLLGFVNAYCFINFFALMFTGAASFNHHSPFYIIIGNVFGFTTLFIFAWKRRYLEIYTYYKEMDRDQKKTLEYRSKRFILISFVGLVAIILLQLYIKT